MKKQVMTILSVIAFIGGFFLLYFSGSKQQVTPVANQINQQTVTNQHWAPKTDNQSEIMITITPIDILSQSKEWKFDVAMNTHSVELQDPTKSIVLVDNQGKEYKPISWDGPTQGHHMNGTLMFNQIVPIPKSIDMKISGVGGVVKSFTW